ncbi:MAG: class I SAM-dependent methyltransferase [Rubrivivax sp.]|nr:class I SAM-dependent methyltransferase [Rubrivivax sp.]
MSTATTIKPPKTWFPVGSWKYERELRHQMQGLRHVLDEVRTARLRGLSLSVLDAACAEGLIGLELLKAGAGSLHGVELLPQRVADARRLAAGLPCTFEAGDLTTWRPERPFDVVLALSILHKLPDPGRVAYGLAKACDRMLVVRLPPPPEGYEGGVIVDRRSGFRPLDLREFFAPLRFNLEEETTGYLGEWIGFWRKR